jgi:hypothetical protein
MELLDHWIKLIDKNGSVRGLIPRRSAMTKVRTGRAVIVNHFTIKLIR